jgi:hypothetical protein
MVLLFAAAIAFVWAMINAPGAAPILAGTLVLALRESHRRGG